MADETTMIEQTNESAADVTTSAAPAAAADPARPTSDAAPATAIAPDGVFVEGAGLVAHPDLPAPTGFLKALEAEVKRAESAGEHATHAVLNDLHMLAVQIKAKAAAAVDKVEGDAADLVDFLHRVL